MTTKTSKKALNKSGRGAQKHGFYGQFGSGPQAYGCWNSLNKRHTAVSLRQLHQLPAIGSISCNVSSVQGQPCCQRRATTNE